MAIPKLGGGVLSKNQKTTEKCFHQLTFVMEEDMNILGKSVPNYQGYIVV